MNKIVCPGCNLGCGLYKNDVLYFRKNAPVNSGKLCRFGMKLHNYEKALPMVDGKEEELSNAISAASKKLAETKDFAFVSFGNVTCEEQLAFTKLASTVGSNVYTCIPGFVGANIEKIRQSTEIITFIDPYNSYPLILRHMLYAKENGAKITSYYWKKIRIADESVILDPTEIDKIKSIDFGDSLVILDLNPLNLEFSNEIINSCNPENIVCLKPFLNSTGASLLSGEEKSIYQIFEEIKEKKIKGLYLLESDPGIVPDDALLSALDELDVLIVQQSVHNSLSDRANIVLPNDRTFEGKGTVLNFEGRALETEGETEGIEIISEILKSGGKEETSYDSLHAEVLSKLGITEIDEYVVPEYNIAYKPETEIKKYEGKAHLIYVYTPFMWNNMIDRDFVEISPGLAKSLNLHKDRLLEMTSSKGSAAVKYKIVETVPDNIVLSPMKLPISTDVITPIEFK